MNSPVLHKPDSQPMTTVPEAAADVLPSGLVQALAHIQVVEVKGRKYIDLRLRASLRGMLSVGAVLVSALGLVVKFTTDHWPLIQEFLNRL